MGEREKGTNNQRLIVDWPASTVNLMDDDVSVGRTD